MTKLLLGLMLVGLWHGCGRQRMVWMETFASGSIQEQYQYYNHPVENERVRDGWYKNYYDSGEFETLGLFEKGKKQGKWILYFENGKIELKNVRGRRLGNTKVERCSGKGSTKRKKEKESGYCTTKMEESTLRDIMYNARKRGRG